MPDKGSVRRAEPAQAPKPTVVVHHVNKTHSGITLYHKEILPGGAVVEEHTVITRRCRRNVSEGKRRRSSEERGEEA